MNKLIWQLWKTLENHPFEKLLITLNILTFIHPIEQMIYFIRHAQSQYNLVEAQLAERLGPDYKQTQEYLTEKFSDKYLDVRITQLGVEQCFNAREEMKGIKLDLVLVSPMRRALQTCHIIFEELEGKVPIVVEPAFREIMESSNDIGSEIAESIQKYPHFDFSRVEDKDAWFVHTLQPADRESILKTIQGLEGEERKTQCIKECIKVEK